MFSKYFQKLEKNLSKKIRSSKKGKGGGAEKSIDINALKDDLNKMIPSRLKIDSLRMIDPSGYTPESVDLIAFKDLYRDMLSIMDGFIPCELVYGTFHVLPMLNKESLNDIIRKVVQVKKINRYAERDESPAIIPAFVIAYNTDIKLPDLKSVLVENYMAMSIDRLSEVDIIVILNNGIIVKDWRDRRTYIAIETGKDSLMWFFILMNEYLDVEKDSEFDPRNYVRHGEKYNEY